MNIVLASPSSPYANKTLLGKEAGAESALGSPHTRAGSSLNQRQERQATLPR
jgi:hypothetical protein